MHQTPQHCTFTNMSCGQPKIPVVTINLKSTVSIITNVSKFDKYRTCRHSPRRNKFYPQKIPIIIKFMLSSRIIPGLIASKDYVHVAKLIGLYSILFTILNPRYSSTLNNCNNCTPFKKRGINITVKSALHTCTKRTECQKT